MRHDAPDRAPGPDPLDVSDMKKVPESSIKLRAMNCNRLAAPGIRRHGARRDFRLGPRLKGPASSAKRSTNLAPRAGFEPATNRLTAGCSTAELPGKSLLAWLAHITKPVRL